MITLIGIAFLILLIDWFNYINLSTASAMKRANEVGVRKVIGATRKSLVSLFLVESLLVNTIAFAAGQPAQPNTVRLDQKGDRPERRMDDVLTGFI